MTEELPVSIQDSTALMRIIDKASLDPHFDVAKLEQLLAVKERWEANEARKAFVVALCEFKANPPEIIKNKHVSFGSTAYVHATLDKVSDSIGKALSIYRLSHRWEVEQPEKGIIRVTCILTHALGHSERVSIVGVADDSGSKNIIQAIGSTITYLQRYTLLAATGTAAKGQDDDGREACPILSESVIVDHLNAIESSVDIHGLQKAFSTAYKAAREAKDKSSMTVFTKAKDYKKKELGAKT